MYENPATIKLDFKLNVFGIFLQFDTELQYTENDNLPTTPVY